MQNPVPASQLANQPYMKCGQPNVGKEICNGLETISISSNIVSGSLLNSCNVNNANWATCYNCPSSEPTLENPTPKPNVDSGVPGFRHPVPTNCDSLWWDPIAGQCLCSNSTCAYNDTSIPVSGTNTSTNKAASATGSTSQQTNANTSGTNTLLLSNVLGIASSVVALAVYNLI